MSDDNPERSHLPTSRRRVLGGVGVGLAGVAASLSSNSSASSSSETVVPDWTNTSGKVGEESRPFDQGWVREFHTQTLDAESASINDFKNRLSVSISPHQFATVRAASSRSDEYINMQGNVSSVYTNLGGDRRDQYGSIYVHDSKIWHHDPTTGQMVEINDNQPDEKNFFAASRDKRGEFLVIVEDGTDADGNVIYEAQFYLDPANIGDSANAHRTATGFGRPRQYGIEQLIDNSGFIFAEYSGTSTSRVIRYDRSVGSFETALDVGSTGLHLHRISINPDNKNMYVVNAHGTTELYESTDDGATWSKLVSDDKRQVEIGRAWPEDGYAYWGADTLWDEGDTEQSRVYRAPVGDQSSPELLGKVPDAGIMIYGNSVSFDPYGILMSGSQDAGRKGADGEHAPLYFWSLEIQEEIGVSNITTENPEPLIKLTEKTLSEGGNSGSFGFRDLPPYMNSEVGGWVVPTASLQKIGPRTEKQVIVTLDKLQSALP